MASAASEYPESGRGGNQRPMLLYAGSCWKCRLLSRLVVIASLGVIRRVPLEIPAWRKFYYEDYPQAQGYPVLFWNGTPHFGAKVFVLTPLVVVATWGMRLRSAIRPGLLRE
jgi:hypothetical protein